MSPYSVPGIDDCATVGAFDAGVSLSFQCTNRETVYDLYGVSTYIGVSNGVLGCFGADVISCADASDLNSGADGFQASIGVGGGVDVHVSESYTRPVGKGNQNSSPAKDTALYSRRTGICTEVINFVRKMFKL